MANIVVTILKVFAGGLLPVVTMCALLAGIGIGAASWATANCMDIHSLACSSAGWLATWWWLAILGLMLPLAALSCFCAVRYFAAPGTRARVVGGVGVIWGGALLIGSLVLSHGLTFNGFGAALLLVGLYLLFRKQKPLRSDGPSSKTGTVRFVGSGRSRE